MLLERDLIGASAPPYPMGRYCASYRVLEYLVRFTQQEDLLNKVRPIIESILSVESIDRFCFSPFFSNAIQIPDELKELTDIGGSAYKAAQMPAYRKYFHSPVFKALALKNIQKTTQTFKIARLMQLKEVIAEQKKSKKFSISDSSTSIEYNKYIELLFNKYD